MYLLVFQKYWGKYSRDCGWPRRLACAMRSLAIVITIVQSFFLSFLSSVFCFLPTLGNFLCTKICFPQYFGITRRHMQKKFKLYFTLGEWNPPPSPLFHGHTGTACPGTSCLSLICQAPLTKFLSNFHIQTRT